jgi:hypothetical protein
VQGRLQSGTGRAARFADDKERTDEAKIRELYLSALGRVPTEKEQAFILQELSQYTNKRQGWEDVIWALINAKEFQFVR